MAQSEGSKKEKKEKKEALEVQNALRLEEDDLSPTEAEMIEKIMSNLGVAHKFTPLDYINLCRTYANVADMTHRLQLTTDLIKVFYYSSSLICFIIR